MRTFIGFHVVLSLVSILTMIQSVWAESSLQFTRFAPKDTAQQNYLSFVSVKGIAVDADGNFYILDSSAKSIVKFSPDGAWLASFGNGLLSAPASIALDVSGNIYVTDMELSDIGYCIKKLSPLGTLSATFGNFGAANGQFSSPTGLAVDTSGNIYVADSGNHRIQKLSPSGAWLATWGSYGTANGRFDSPQSVAVDNSGNIYVADKNNSRIQKLSPNGTWLASWGSYGTGDGQFGSPQAMAVDASDNVYVADIDNNRIQKLSSNGTWLTNWGSYGSDNGQYDMPMGIALDSSGNVYVADSGNHRIQKLSSSGAWLASWKSSSGSGDAQFGWPMGVAVDASGNVYVADAENNRIQKLSSNGTWLANFGSYGSDNGQFYRPWEVTLDSSGNVYVLDAANCRVQKLSSSGTWLASWGSCGTGNGQFKNPLGLALDINGNIYVSDTNNNRIQKLSSSGAWLASWGSPGQNNGQFHAPRGVAVDADGNVYVADANNSRIQKFSSSGTWLSTWGSEGTDNGQFKYPTFLKVDTSGNVYVADTGNLRIQKLSSSGTWLATWKNIGSGSDQFYGPTGLALDTNGNIYVVDSDNYRIMIGRQSPSATITGIPTSPTDQSSASLTITGSAITKYKYRVDGGALSGEHPLANPLLIYGLADGEHTVTVLGGDDAGQWQQQETTATWTVQGGTITYPRVEFTAHPLISPGFPDPYIQILSIRGYVTKGLMDFTGCQLVESDIAGPGECTWELWSMSGNSAFEIIEAGAFYWAGITFPRATISGVPPSPTNQTTASLTIGGSNVTTYKYRLDGANWSEERAVATAISLTGLTEGIHTVEVIACAGGVWQSESSPTSVSWTVDATSPIKVSISGQPESLTGSTGATITIGGEGIVSYKWSMDGINWSDPIGVGTVLSLSGLGDGQHTLSLLGGDAAGNWQVTPFTYTWTVDTTPPTATLTSPPPSPTRYTSIVLNLVAGDMTAYKYKLDNGDYGPETPVAIPITLDLTSLNDGSHSVAIVGRDSVGNWQSEANASLYGFIRDTVAPIAVISGVPQNPTNNTNATLSVSGNDVLLYEYKLDDNAWQEPRSTSVPIGFGNLRDGSHTVSVKGIDAAGNIQVTPTGVTWVVDTVAPLAVVTGTPSSPTHSKTATLDVSGDGVRSYKYKLDDGGYSASPIDVATDISLSDLVDGGHMLSVIGVDAAGNWQPEVWPTVVTWVVDTQAPTATLTGVPHSPTNSQNASIVVSGDGVNVYQSALDNESFGAETAVATPILLYGLGNGSHTLRVKGRDLAGNWQQTPTIATWVVNTLVPVAVIVGAPIGSTTATTATITVSGTGVESYKYMIDAGSYSQSTPVVTAITLTGLADGSHTLSVLGGNAAGTWQTTPTTASWTVNTAAPTPILSGVPTSPTNSSKATITVGGTGVTDYQYQLDTGSWSAKTPKGNPIVLTGLGNGSHTLAVIGCDNLGNCQSQAAPVTATWIVDTQEPAMPTIPAASNPVRQTTNTPTLVWTSVSDAADYLIEVADNAGFNAPRVQKAVSGETRYRLASLEALDKRGMWYWRVRARDAAGNVSTWASASFNYQSGGLPHLFLLMQ